ncbi:MAG TPA: NAD(P)-dependent oxidoreductase [Polyangia bacterium]|nr:NAD(P)-dependent oxidoreductase [Polyangia bacterium]
MSHLRYNLARSGRTSARSVLVTGACGFLGRRVCQALSATGWRVTGLDRRLAPLEKDIDVNGFHEFWRCDLRDAVSIARRQPPRPFDAIVHLDGSPPGQGSLEEMLAENAAGTAALLDVLGGTDCHVVLFSTGLVYGPQKPPLREAMVCLPVDAYARSKLVAESLARARCEISSTPLTIVRPSVVYGEGAPGLWLNTLLTTLRKGDPFATMDGEQIRDFLHVDDAAEAVLAILETGTVGTWNVASGTGWTVRAAARLAGDIAGRADLIHIGALGYRPGEVSDFRLEAEPFKRATGWAPQIDLPTGLRQLWNSIS